MRRRATLSSHVEGFAQQRLAEHFLHCTCVWGVWQVPNLDAVPAMGLKEIGLRQRSGNRLAVVVSPSYLDFGQFCQTRHIWRFLTERLARLRAV